MKNFKYLSFLAFMLLAIPNLGAMEEKKPSEQNLKEYNAQMRLKIGSNVSKEDLNEAFFGNNDTSFELGDIVLIKRSDGSYTYGYIDRIQGGKIRVILEKPIPGSNNPILNKTVKPQDVGNFLKSPNFLNDISEDKYNIKETIKTENSDSTDKTESDSFKYPTEKEFRDLFNKNLPVDPRISASASFDKNNKFGLHEIVVIKRTDGSYSYGIKAYGKNEGKFPIKLSDGRTKELAVELIGKLKGSPVYGLDK